MFLHVTLLDNRSEFSSQARGHPAQGGRRLCGGGVRAIALANTVAYIGEAIDPISIFIGLTRRDLRALESCAIGDRSRRPCLEAARHAWQLLPGCAGHGFDVASVLPGHPGAVLLRGHVLPPTDGTVLPEPPGGVSAAGSRGRRSVRPSDEGCAAGPSCVGGHRGADAPLTLPGPRARHARSWDAIGAIIWCSCERRQLGVGVVPARPDGAPRRESRS